MMNKLLLLMLALSCTVRAMDLRVTELRLSKELCRMYPVSPLLCGLFKQRKSSWLTRPETISTLGEAYKAVLAQSGDVDAVVASIQNVQKIIAQKTAHLSGRYVESSRHNWIAKVLHDATQDSLYRGQVLWHFPSDATVLKSVAL